MDSDMKATEYFESGNKTWSTERGMVIRFYYLAACLCAIFLMTSFTLKPLSPR
jgi:hypothetical protein